MSTVPDSTAGQGEWAGGIASKPILLVESVFQSVVLISRVFRELNLLDQLAISMDCESALVRLRQSSSKPRLILLNRNMPRMSAQSFLKVIKEDDELCVVPVVVLADSYQAEDVATYYDLGTAGYMVRTNKYMDILEKMKALCTYWTLSRSPAMY